MQTVSAKAIIREMDPEELKEYARHLYRKMYNEGITNEGIKEFQACQRNHLQLTGKMFYVDNE